MADEKHLEILKQGVDAWNKWRQDKLLEVFHASIREQGRWRLGFSLEENGQCVRRIESFGREAVAQRLLEVITAGC